MDNDYYSETLAALEKAATDFKRAVDKQIVAFENEKRLHEEAIRSIDEKISALQQREKELLDQKNELDVNASNKEKEANEIVEEITNLRKRERELEQEKVNKQQEFAEKRRRIELQTTEMNREKQNDGDNKELTNGLLYYTQRLQMFLNKDTEGIRITFRCIDPSHPKRRFYVVLKVNDNEKWELLRTKPSLSNERELMEKLNESNDINCFLRSVRKSFKAQYCETPFPI